MAELDISIEGVDTLRHRITAFSKSNLVSLNKEIGYNAQERTADWLARTSVTRHKSADELGAKHTGYLEFAPGRVRSVCRFSGGSGKRPEIHIANVSDGGVDIVFENTPGLRRAFGAYDIRPVKAKALTIPKNKVSYARSVAELKAEGHVIYQPKGTRILVEDKNKKNSHRNGDKPNWRILYLLTSKVHIKHDPELLPDAEHFQEWAAETIEAYIDLHEMN